MVTIVPISDAVRRVGVAPAGHPSPPGAHHAASAAGGRAPCAPDQGPAVRAGRRAPRRPVSVGARPRRFSSAGLSVSSSPRAAEASSEATNSAVARSIPVPARCSVNSSTEQVPVDDRRAGDLGDRLGELGERERGPAELPVALLVGDVAGEQRDRGLGVVRPGGRGDAALSGGPDDLAAREELVEPAGVVLGVPAVAGHRERQARALQDVLGLGVLGGERELGLVGVDHAGVDDHADVGRVRRVDHRGVLADAVPGSPGSRRAAGARCPRAPGRGCRGGRSRPRGRRPRGRPGPWPSRGHGRGRTRCRRGRRDGAERRRRGAPAGRWRR